jgi:thiol-disulfide isomerase/thioredoxin
MRIRNALAIISALAVSGLASAQGSLTIGDKAPALPVDGFVKGDKIDHLEKGKTYVVEFWATWCGPCIASLPHLSEMAEKFKGDVSFVSVNTWDYTKDASKVAESKEVHVTRVNEWVTKNTDKMRYNIVLDDDKDTISTTWMRAAGRNGIPCAFIVNDQGVITWIGHPMQMERVLDSVKAKTWDMAAFKTKFDADAAGARAVADAQKNPVIKMQLMHSLLLERARKRMRS